jgi:hypothetical protein
LVALPTVRDPAAAVVVMLFTLLGPTAPAEAQDAVALFVSGESGSSVADAFTGLVDVDEARRVVGADPDRVAGAEADPEVGYVVMIDTDADVVRVLRRSDGARFQKRFEASDEDNYALALVATELLEVARSGGDPVALGLTGEASTDDSSESAASGDSDADPPPEDGASPIATEVATEPTGPTDEVFQSESETLALTLGAGAEVWATFGEAAPWLVEPTLFFDVMVALGAKLRVGGGVFVTGLGRFEGESVDAVVAYSRYDVGARGTLGLDVGPVATRLLLHVRVGGAVVVGEGRTTSLIAQETSSESVGAFFAGLGVEARQPLTLGLELFLQVFADALPSPVTFVAFGASLVAEGPFRIGAQAGLSWRFR